MDAIDFSAKHDVLIRHQDGTLTPMDVPYYETKQLNETTWQIMSSGDYHYLLAGDDMGVAIDTGYGAGNLREYLEGLCKKPVPWVINTHYHFDHTANDFYFDMAYMAEEAVPRAAIPYESFAGIPFPKPDFPKTVVGDGDIVPLKGRELEIIGIGDHTEDGIAILDRTCRMLFVGDEMMPLRKSLNGSVSKWKADLEKLLAHKDEFDRILGGPGEVPKESLDIFYEAACRILAGKPSEEVPPQKEKPLPSLEKDEEGHQIYDCKKPHYEDIPHGGFNKVDPNMVTYYYKGYTFQYDRTMM